MGRRGKLPPINLTDDERAELERLESRRIDISTVDLGTPKRFLPRSWQRVVDRLVDAKVPVRQSQFPRVDSAGNLGAARKRGFVPEKSDNSLQLFRPHGPVEAAEQVAALLSRFSDDAEPFIVVGGDALLDAQLRRFFVPTLGSSYGASDNAYAELLSLVLELSWSPTHPARVHELLAHPDGPVPATLSRDLLRALSEWPSVKSPPFLMAIEKWGKDSPEGDRDGSSRAKASSRVKVLLSSISTGDNVPLQSLMDRIAVLEQWMRGKATSASANASDQLLAAAGSCCTLRQTLQTSGFETFSRPLLRQLVRLAPQSETHNTFAAEAGSFVVAHPGGLAAPAQRVVWWNFTEASFARENTIPLSRAERRSLLRLAYPFQPLASSCKLQPRDTKGRFGELRSNSPLSARKRVSMASQFIPIPFGMRLSPT